MATDDGQAAVAAALASASVTSQAQVAAGDAHPLVPDVTDPVADSGSRRST